MKLTKIIFDLWRNNASFAVMIEGVMWAVVAYLLGLVLRFFTDRNKLKEKRGSLTGLITAAVIMLFVTIYLAAPKLADTIQSIYALIELTEQEAASALIAGTVANASQGKTFQQYVDFLQRASLLLASCFASGFFVRRSYTAIQSNPELVGVVGPNPADQIDDAEDPELGPNT